MRSDKLTLTWMLHREVFLFDCFQAYGCEAVCCRETTLRLTDLIPRFRFTSSRLLADDSSSSQMKPYNYLFDTKY